MDYSHPLQNHAYVKIADVNEAHAHSLSIPDYTEQCLVHTTEVTDAELSGPIKLETFQGSRTLFLILDKKNL